MAHTQNIINQSPLQNNIGITYIYNNDNMTIES